MLEMSLIRKGKHNIQPPGYNSIYNGLICSIAVNTHIGIIYTPVVFVIFVWGIVHVYVWDSKKRAEEKRPAHFRGVVASIAISLL